ncbi:MAG TPA: hypothetical protein VFF76_06070 [Holophagaceae bacterium]|jgi:hypothetical protein|nr:hypothetical protein [Holophagaceae bacterium]
MGIPSIKLNLVPEPSLWREQHIAFGWAALALGAAVFLGVSGYTAWSYQRASQAGKAAVSADAQTHLAATQERQLLSQLQQVDVDQELPRWRLAERILSERAAPWSRLAAELEQNLVDGARIKNMERTRGADQALLLKVKAEARSRDAESGFIENLRKDPAFTQVALEREAQQPGGGWEFDLSLPVVPLPPPFAPVTAEMKTRTPAHAQAAAPASVPAPRAAPAPETVHPATPSSPRQFGAATGPRGPVVERPASGGARPAPAIQRRPQPGGAS